MAGQSKEAPIPPWGLAVAGATGAVIANAMVYPLDMWVFLSPTLSLVFLAGRTNC
jgi:hypothetical protein